MRHHWRIRRQLVERPEGQQRWDYAYQYLLRWTALSPREQLLTPQEVDDESGRLCACVYAAPSAGPDS